MRRALLPTAAVICLLLLVWWLPRSGDETASPVGPGPDTVPNSSRDPKAGETPEDSHLYTGEDRLRVKGLVLDALTYGPIEGCSVTLRYPDGAWSVTSDASGSWSLDIPPVRFRKVEGGGHWPRPRLELAAKGYVPYATETHVPPGCREFRICERLHPIGARVAGRVVDADGRAVPGAQVMVSQRFHDRSCRTDAHGRFASFELPVGQHGVWACSVGRGRGSQTVLVLPGVPSKRMEIEIVLGAPGFARGRVVDGRGRPLHGVKVEADELDLGVSCLTDADGRFRWPLPSSDWPMSVIVTKSGFDTREYLHKLDPLLETEIVMHRVAYLEGVLQTCEGTPVPWAVVRAGPPGEGVVTACGTGEDGRFVLGPFCPGELLIQIARGAIPLGRFEQKVESSGRHAGVVLRLPPLDSYEGRVTDSSTRLPLSGVRVITGLAERGLITESDAEGRFRFPYAADLVGDDFFYLVMDGYMPLNAGYHVTETALSPLGRVRMRIVDPDGRPLPGTGATFGSTSFGHAWWVPQEAHADADGRIEIELPVVAAPEVEVDHPRCVVRRLEIAPVAGQTTDLGDIRLEPADTLSFIVRDEEGRSIPEAYLLLRREPWLVQADARGRIRAPRRFESGVILTAPGYVSFTRTISFPVHKVEVIVLTKGAPVLGRVVDDAGNPAAGVIVRSFGSVATSDARGRFSLSGFAAGENVRVEVDEWTRGLLHRDRAWSVAGGDEVTLVRPRPGRLGVRVPEGKDVPEALFEVHHLDYPRSEFRDPVWRRSVSLEDGVSRLEVSPGRLAVRFAPEGGVPKFWHDVRVAPGAETMLLYDHPRAGRLSGRVVDDQGILKAGVELVNAVGGSLVAVSGEDGRLEAVENTVCGLVPLLAKADEHAPTFLGLVDLENGADLLVRLSRGGAVRGTLVASDGTTFFDAKVRIRSSVQWIRHGDWVDVDYKGSFGFRDRVPAGRQILEVRVGGDDRLPMLGPVRHEIRKEFTVEDGRDARVEVRLP